MIRIAFVIDRLYGRGGGTEGQLLMLMEGLDRSQFSPHLVCLRETEYVKEGRFPFGVTILKVDHMGSAELLGGILRFRKLNKACCFQIVQTVFFDANVVGTIAARIGRVPVIISSRRNLGYWQRRMDLWILQGLRRWTTYYIANSHSAADRTIEVEGVPAERVAVIRNGLDLKPFEEPAPLAAQRQRLEWGIGKGDLVIGALANLRKIKNVDALVMAATILCREFSNLRFVWCGESLEGERARLMALVERQGLKGRFLFPGPVSNVRITLAAFDVGVLCSRSESLSNSLMEYMAAGLPIVASDVGGNRETVEHERTGLLYSNDSLDELTNTLRRLVRDPGLARRLGDAARVGAFQGYNKEVMIREHEKVYLGLVGGSR